MRSRLVTIGWWLLVLGGLGLSVIFASHQSENGRVLGRYSTSFAALLGLATGMTLVFLAVVVGWRRRLAARLHGLAAPLRRHAGWLALLAALGVVGIATLALLGSLYAEWLDAPLFLLSLTVIWLGAVLTFAGLLAPPRRTRALGDLAAVLVGCVFAAGLGEVALRLLDDVRPYRVLPADLRFEVDVPSNIITGIDPPSWLTTDGWGIRGTESYPEDEGRLRILAIGGSTTLNRRLDDTETWCARLAATLEERRHELLPWCGSIGRPGFGAGEHVWAMRRFVPQLDIDVAVVLVGVNDLIPALRWPGRNPGLENADAVELFATRSFFDAPLRIAPEPWPRSLAWYQLAARLGRNRGPESSWGRETLDSRHPQPARDRWSAAPEERDELPDLEPALEVYEANLERLIAAAAELEIDLVLVTQPALWRADLEPEPRARLWMGVVGSYEAPKARWSPAALSRAMHLYNERLRKVVHAHRRTADGAERPGGSVALVDLAPVMDGDVELFWDDVHFTELGAQCAGAEIASLFAPTREAPRCGRGYLSESWHGSTGLSRPSTLVHSSIQADRAASRHKQAPVQRYRPSTSKTADRPR
ncbi:MAG: hypothetical protein AAGD38_03095 [Acidobacteriota bacterium]